MFSYHKILIAILSVSFLANISHAMDLAAVHAANQRAIAAAQAKQAAEAAQRARDANHARMQDQWKAQQQQQKKK